MYTKDKSNRITLRLNDEQFDFVKSTADGLGVSPSAFLRMIVNVAFASSQKSQDVLTDDVVEEMAKESIRRENEITHNDCIV